MILQLSFCAHLGYIIGLDCCSKLQKRNDLKHRILLQSMVTDSKIIIVPNQKFQIIMRLVSYAREQTLQHATTVVNLPLQIRIFIVLYVLAVIQWNKFIDSLDGT